MSSATRSSPGPRLAVVVLALSFLAVLLLRSPAPAATGGHDQQSDAQAVSFGHARAPSFYWGAWIGDQLNGTEPPYDMSAVNQFETMVGKRMSLVEWAWPFAHCPDLTACPPYGFPVAEMDKVRAHGSIPVLSWASAGGPDINQPDFQLSDVIAGRYDDLIRNFAIGARDWGHPFFLRFNWEMNGNWFPWSELVNGNHAGEYEEAWRHVHDIFDQVGATNANWVWCPYVDVGAGFHYDDLYPGDAYVDWTCLDGYNWAHGPAVNAPWRKFDQVFRANYFRVTRDLAPNKPMMLGEVATSDFGGNKTAWIRDMLTKLAKVPSAYPKIHAVVYFDVDDRSSHWPIETSPSVVKAFRIGIQDDAFAPSRFGQIAGDSIRPLPGRKSDFNQDAGG